MKVGSMVAWTVVHLAVGLAAGWVVSTAVLLVGQKDASTVVCLVARSVLNWVALKWLVGLIGRGHGLGLGIGREAV